VRPTFDLGNPGQPAAELPALVETHLLDTDLDLYGTTLEVQFVSKLRAEKKFSGVEALKLQIRQDCDDARAALARSKHASL
jgi:riboflavin kinase/FMN adenylyltransferase